MNAMTNAMTDEARTEPVPPYVSFQTLMNQVDRMSTEGVPGRIDGTYLVGMAGGTQNQLKHALRSLGLIEGPENRTSTDLRSFVTQNDDRPQILADLLRRRFPRLVNLEQDATMGQLDDALATYGLGADTRRKAATFYLAAATFAGLPISPQFKTSKTSKPRKSSTSATRRPTSKGSRSNGEAGSQQPSGNMVGSTTLRSGGTVTIVVNANLFDLSEDDQEFVTGLVKTLRSYKGVTEAPSVETTTEGTTDGERV
jgi:hypothetical protein